MHFDCVKVVYKGAQSNSSKLWDAMFVSILNYLYTLVNNYFAKYIICLIYNIINLKSKDIVVKTSQRI